MSRHEKNFEAIAEARLAVEELWSLAARRASGTEADTARDTALACFLAGGDGWNDAQKALGGSFASPRLIAKDAKIERPVNQSTSEYFQWAGIKAVSASVIEQVLAKDA